MKLLLTLIPVTLNLLLMTALAAKHGLAYLSLPPWSLTLPLWLLWLLLISSVTLYRYSWQLLCSALQLPHTISAWLAKLHRQCHERHLVTGLIASQLASWQDAEQNLIAGLGALPTTAINYLFAAQAAYKQGAWERCQQHLRQLNATTAAIKLASAILAIKVAVAQHCYQQAFAELVSLSKQQPYQPSLAQLVSHCTQQDLPWEQLLTLLGIVTQHKIAKRQALHAINKAIYSALLHQAQQQQRPQQQLLDLWQHTPQQVRLEPCILAAFVQLLLTAPHTTEEFELLIRKLLQQSWQPELVLWYGLLPAPANKQLQFITTCYQRYGREPLLLLSAGRLASRCQLWGQAKAYLLESLSKAPRPDTNFALAALFTKLGEERQALNYYQAGIQKQTQFYQVNI